MKNVPTFSAGNQKARKFLGSDAGSPLVKNSFVTLPCDNAHLDLAISSNLNLVYGGKSAKKFVAFKIVLSVSTFIFLELFFKLAFDGNTSIFTSYINSAPGKIID